MKESFLKIIYKLSAIIVSILIITYALFFLIYAVKRKYLYPLYYNEEISYYCNVYTLDNALIFAIIKTESNFNNNVISNKGAIGLMQILPSTGEYIAKLKGDASFDLLDPKNNIEYGCYYVRYLLNKFENVDTMLCAYNAGEGNVINWLKDKSLSNDGVKLIYIPFEETTSYIYKVNKNLKKYQKLYPDILDKPN